MFTKGNNANPRLHQQTRNRIRDSVMVFRGRGSWDVCHEQEHEFGLTQASFC